MLDAHPPAAAGFSLSDLPRLSDSDREALDSGYVALEGIPAFSLDDLVSERIDALKAMRVAAGNREAFAVAAAREADLAARIRRLRRGLAAIAAAAALAGCSLTPTQTKWAGFAAGVLVVGAIAAHDSDSGKPPAVFTLTAPNLPCRPQPDGSCR